MTAWPRSIQREWGRQAGAGKWLSRCYDNPDYGHVDVTSRQGQDVARSVYSPESTAMRVISLGALRALAGGEKSSGNQKLIHLSRYLSVCLSVCLSLVIMDRFVRKEKKKKKKEEKACGLSFIFIFVQPVK